MPNGHECAGCGRAILFWGGILFTLAAPVLIGLYLRDASIAWIAVACGVFVTIMAKFDDLVEFSLGPLRARMRETINEANATIEQLRKVAVTSARATLTNLMSGNFMDGTTLRTRLDLHDQYIDTLGRIGVSEVEIGACDELWRKGVGVIYHRGIGHCLNTLQSQHPADSEPGKAFVKAMGELQDMLDFETWSAPSPERIQHFLNDRKIVNNDIAELISDYRYFLDTGEIRRRDVFVRL